MSKMFPVIDLEATGENITRLRKARGLTVRDLQNWFGFEEPQAIYKWQKGKSLPTVDNLYALGTLLDVPMEEILVPRKPELNIVSTGQQDVSCCPPIFLAEFIISVLQGRKADADILRVEKGKSLADLLFYVLMTAIRGSVCCLKGMAGSVLYPRCIY